MQLESDKLDFTIVSVHEEDELIVRHLANETLSQIGSRESDLAGKQVRTELLNAHVSQ